MKIKPEGNWQGLEEGFELLRPKLDLELAPDGLPLRLEAGADEIEVRLQAGRGLLRFGERIQFFRALGLFVEAARAGQDFQLREQPQFDTVGVMVDMSRNAVLTVESIQDLLREMAVMGLNTLMLYTEDTYTIDGEPYFGYLRGRYSADELEACADYAEALGIEIVPCIQTLAHLDQFLKWPVGGRDLIDTNGVLLVGSEATYALIEKMIAAICVPLRSKRIHIGMDEALGIGRGRYLDLHGQHDRFEIISRHLGRVLEITARHGLRPMIWSDMYFRIASATHDYYDLQAAIPDEVKRSVPAGVELVYWDYYNEDPHFYDEYIRRHRELCPDVVFAGGGWNWNGMGVSYGKVFASANAALASCKRQGVRQVILTLWGDDGAENNFFSALLALQLYAEHAYAAELDQDKLARRVQFCTGVSYQAFNDLRYLDETPGTLPDNLEFGSPANPAKFLLWQDPLLGLFDRQVQGLDLPGHYARLAEQLDRHCRAYPARAALFELPHRLCAVLELKSDLGLRLKQAYDCDDRAALRAIADEQLPELVRRVRALRAAQRAHWMSTCKPFGWEVLDLRYGGLLARLESAAERLDDYLQGRITAIEELQPERLGFDGRERPQPGVSVGFCNQYTRIVTPGLFSLIWPPI